jgi:hypothetical protein
MAVRFGFPHPFPGVLKPVAPVLAALVGKPGDFVIAPDPDSSRFGLAGGFADAPIIEFDQIRQVLAPLAVGSHPAFASAINAIGKACLQCRFLRMLGILHNPQGKGMEIKEQMALPQQATGGNVPIAQHKVPTRVLGCIGHQVSAGVHSLFPVAGEKFAPACP